MERELDRLEKLTDRNFMKFIGRKWIIRPLNITIHWDTLRPTIWKESLQKNTWVVIVVTKLNIS